MKDRQMTKNPKRPDNQRQTFEQTARELGCDEDEAKFDAALKKVAAHKPVAEPHAKPKSAKAKI